MLGTHPSLGKMWEEGKTKNEEKEQKGWLGFSNLHKNILS